MPFPRQPGHWIYQTAPVWVSGALALLLSLRGITAQPLSHDEFYSLHAVTAGLDQHLFELPWLPYYAVLWLWTGGGAHTSDAWLRLLSALSVSVMAMCVAATGMRLRSRSAGLAAGLLIALNPALQRFGQDARAYALGAALFAGATYCVARGIMSDGKRPWVAYAPVMMLATLVTPFGLAIAPAQGLVVWLYSHSRAKMRYWLVSCLLPVPVALAGAYIAATKFDSPKAWAPRPGLLDLPAGLEWLGSAAATPLAASGAFAGLLLGLSLLSREGSRWFAGALTGLATVALASLGPSSFWAGQYVLPLVCLVAIGAGITLALHGRWTFVGVLVVAAVLSIPAFTSLRMVDPREPDMRQAAALVNDRFANGDVIYDDGQIFGLASAVRHYVGGPVTTTGDPSGPFWTVYGGPSCEALEQFDLGGDARLQRCRATRVP